MKLKDRTLLCVFNWSAEPEKLAVKLPKAGQVTELWSEEKLGRQQGTLQVELKGHEGKVLVLQ